MTRAGVGLSHSSSARGFDSDFVLIYLERGRATGPAHCRELFSRNSFQRIIALVTCPNSGRE